MENKQNIEDIRIKIDSLDKDTFEFLRNMTSGEENPSECPHGQRKGYEITIEALPPYKENCITVVWDQECKEDK